MQEKAQVRPKDLSISSLLLFLVSGTKKMTKTIPMVVKTQKISMQT
jgi:hypothetical protein